MDIPEYPDIEGQDLTIHPASPYRAHRLAAAFPFLAEGALQDHMQSIKQYGQIEPIVLFNGSVLDGRNTLWCLTELGITPKFRQFGDRPTDGESPAQFVFARNFHRRHLSPGQRAGAATNFIPFFEHEARLRQTATRFAPKAASPEGNTAKENLPSDGNVAEPGAEQAGGEPDLSLSNEPETPPPSAAANTPLTTGSKKGRVRDQVAEQFGTSSGMIRIAARLKKKAPDLFQKVMNGEMKPGTADSELDRRIAEAAQGENALKEKKEREDALAKIKSTWQDKKYEPFVAQIEEKKLLKKHSDLLVFADIAKSRALKLVPLIKLGWNATRAEEFLAGKIEEETALREIFLFAISNSKAKTGKPVEHSFEIIAHDCGEYSSWTVSVHCDPSVKPAPVGEPPAL